MSADKFEIEVDTSGKRLENAEFDYASAEMKFENRSRKKSVPEQISFFEKLIEKIKKSVRCSNRSYRTRHLLNPEVPSTSRDSTQYASSEENNDVPNESLKIIVSGAFLMSEVGLSLVESTDRKSASVQTNRYTSMGQHNYENVAPFGRTSGLYRAEVARITLEEEEVSGRRSWTAFRFLDPP